jgi:hypothetical protein
MQSRGNRDIAIRDFFLQRFFREEGERLMKIAMIHNQVTISGHAPRQIRRGASGFAADAEGHSDTLLGQHVEQSRRNFRVRTVVEAQQHLAPLDPDVFNALPDGPSRSQPLRQFHG